MVSISDFAEEALDWINNVFLGDISKEISHKRVMGHNGQLGGGEGIPN